MAFAPWKRTITNNVGNIVPSASVEVRRTADNSLATLFSDSGTTPLTNPFNADGSTAEAEFFAAPDRYTVTVTMSGDTATIFEDLVDARSNLSFATRALFVAWVAGGGVAPPGAEVPAGRVSYVYSQGSTVIADLPNWIPFGDYTPYHFGAGGLGMTDDTTAISRAVLSGQPIEFGSGVYNTSSQITATVSALNWKSTNARIIYTGTTDIQYVMRLTVPANQNTTLDGRLVFDGGDDAFSCIRIDSSVTTGSAASTWPTLSMKGLVVQNYRRADQTMTGGDGIFITGGWRSVYLDTPEVRNGIMSAGAGIPLSQGIFAITIGDNNAPEKPRDITIMNPIIENLWSEDPLHVLDQDAIRIIQDLEAARDADARFNLIGGSYINIANRIVKLSNVPNPVIRGLQIFYDNTVVPQTAVSSNPTIDAQQAAAIISDIKAVYRGRTPDRFINNYSQQDDHPDYGGSVTNVFITLSDGAGTNMDVVALTGSGLATKDSNTRLKVVNVGVEGGVVKNLLAVRADENSATDPVNHRIDLINCTANCAENFVEFSGQNTTPALVTAVNCAHLGASAIAFSNKSGSWDVQTINCDNFNDLTQAQTVNDRFDFMQGTTAVASISNTGGGTFNDHCRVVRNNPDLILEDSIGGNASAMSSNAGSLILYNDFESGGVAGTIQFRVGGGECCEPNNGYWKQQHNQSLAMCRRLLITPQLLSVGFWPVMYTEEPARDLTSLSKNPTGRSPENTRN